MNTESEILDAEQAKVRMGVQQLAQPSCLVCGCEWRDELVARMRAVLTDCRDWLDNPDGGEPDSNELLRRINGVLYA